MGPVIFKTFISVLLTIIVYVSGFKLRIKGEPYKTGTFAIHKISVVALVVFVVLIYIEHFKKVDFNGIGLTIFILSTLFFIIAFVSGALLSFENIVKFKWKWIHLLSSVITLLMALLIWLVCH